MNSLLRVALPAVLLALFTIGLPAQVATSTAGTASRPAPLLDHDEMMQLNAAREKVFAAHPELKAENDKLKAMHETNPSPTADQRDAAMLEWADYRKKMRAALLQVDPTLKPILAKIEAAGTKAK